MVIFVLILKKYCCLLHPNITIMCFHDTLAIYVCVDTSEKHEKNILALFEKLFKVYSVFVLHNSRRSGNAATVSTSHWSENTSALLDLTPPHQHLAVDTRCHLQPVTALLSLNFINEAALMKRTSSLVCGTQADMRPCVGDIVSALLLMCKSVATCWWSEAG